MRITFHEGKTAGEAFEYWCFSCGTLSLAAHIQARTARFTNFGETAYPQSLPLEKLWRWRRGERGISTREPGMD